MLDSMIEIPPGRYFISHSYRDAATRDALLKQLPAGVKPFIFPPIQVAPKDFVSSNLIEAILASDGLIYLDGGYSARSFWVAFERDYALRARKPVFAYDSETSTIIQQDVAPLELPIFTTCSLGDQKAVEG